MSRRRPPGRWAEPLRWAQLIAGVLLMIAAPIIGILPGPVGIVLFGLGLALTLRASPWARRFVVRKKKRYPKVGWLVDRGLMRKRRGRPGTQLRR